jgi:hypothetical protein
MLQSCELVVRNVNYLKVNIALDTLSVIDKKLTLIVVRF